MFGRDKILLQNFHCRTGNFLTARSRHEDAARLVTQAAGLPHGSRDYEVLFSAANAHRQNKNYDKAEELYRRAVDLKPEV